MNGRTLGFLMTGLVAAATACAQGHRQGPAVNAPPVAGSPAEQKVLGVLGALDLPGPPEHRGPAEDVRDRPRARFIDAEREGYASYLQALLPLVRPGGLITADNVAMAPDYVRAVTTDPRLDTVFFRRFAVTLRKR